MNGYVRWMETDGQKSICYRTGVVAVTREGASFEPGTDGVVEGLAISGSSVRAEMEITRVQRELKIRELWRFQAARMDVEVRVPQVGKQPLQLSSLCFEVGVDPEVLPEWEKVSSDGRKRHGQIPQSMPSTGGTAWVDLFDGSGAGVIIELKRCALMTKWQSGFSGITHTAGRTEIGLLRGVRLDPGDAVLATFALIPHDATGGTPETPVIVKGEWVPARAE